MNTQQWRNVVVLQRLLHMVIEDQVESRAFAEDLDDFLDTLAAQDAFGTEQQNDPRGDFRERIWSVVDVQGRK